MMAFQQILFVINVLLTLVFGIDYFVVESPKVQPKTKARMGVLLAVLFLAFLVLMLLFAVVGALARGNVLFLALSLYAVIPFVIGRLVTYRTLRFYAAVQLLAFLLSAVTLCMIGRG